MTHLIDDLYDYNDWANQKVLSLCDGLTDEQLDTPREMGFGTLRATLFHILTAEVVWMERWQFVPWRPFPTDPAGMSLADITDGLKDVAVQRRELISVHQGSAFQNRIKYQDSKKTPYDHVLFDLLLHVASHGVHHRAQALNYLKQFDRTVVAGIDYIFYRLAKFSVDQSPEAMEGLVGYGLTVSDPTDQPCPWDPKIATRLFAYHDWAVEKVLQFVSQISDESLDQEFNIGPGSLRKTLLHLFDAETWWIHNWTVGPSTFPISPANTPISQLYDEWKSLAGKRNEFIKTVDQAESQRVVEVLAGGPPTRFRVGESIVHLAIHGTHHRAQIINMCRHVEAPWSNIDLLYALSDLTT